MGFEGSVEVRDLNERTDLGTFGSLKMTMPAHSAKLFRVEGKRTEIKVYEAEWAYVPQFTRLRETEKVKYEPWHGASCAVAATDVGAGDGYSLEWKDVYSFRGKYAITVVCAAEPGIQIILSVNGKIHVGTIVSEGLSEISFLVELKKGSNMITVGNPDAEIGAVYCILYTVYSILYTPYEGSVNVEAKGRSLGSLNIFRNFARFYDHIIFRHGQHRKEVSLLGVAHDHRAFRGIRSLLFCEEKFGNCHSCNGG